MSESILGILAGITPVEGVIGGVLLLLGLAIGVLSVRGSRPNRRRFADLEAKLETSEAARLAQSAKVDKHFAQTSDLFGDLTRQYTALYAHLAEGARELVSEEARTALTRGFDAGPALVATGQALEDVEGAAELAPDGVVAPAQAEVAEAVGAAEVAEAAEPVESAPEGDADESGAPDPEVAAAIREVAADLESEANGRTPGA